MTRTVPLEWRVGAPYSVWTSTGSVPVQVSSQASTYVNVGISATEPDGSTIDPSVDAVSFAFLPLGSVPDGSTAWHAGTWAESGAGFTARVVVGSAGVVVAIGEYGVWVRVTDNPEIPILPAGTLSVI